jgi:hypothetical protein
MRFLLVFRFVFLASTVHFEFEKIRPAADASVSYKPARRYSQP